MHTPDDRELIQRTLRGDSQAFGELVRAHQRSVFNVCYRMLANRQAAEDLTQEAFLHAYRNLKNFDLQRPFAPWMYRSTGCMRSCW